MTQRLIFCINSGRSGSEYLAHLLDTAAHTDGVHENRPSMHGYYLEPTLRAPMSESFEFRRDKERAIRQHMAQRPDGYVYAETNHMFIKTFYDVVMECLAPSFDVRVVLLRRKLPSVLRSFVSLGLFTPTCEDTPKWMPGTETYNAVFKPPHRDAPPDQIDRILGYLIDTEARAQQFIASYPSCPVVEANLEDVITEAGALSLFASLELEPTEATRSMVGAKVNAREARKAELGVSISLDECKTRIAGYLERCRQQGVVVPALPHAGLAP
jgi:hypothetical protein